MKLLVVAVGQRMPDWVDEEFEEYSRRMPRELPMQLIEVKEDRRLAAAVPRDAYRVMLDEHGRMLSTVDLSERIAAWQMDGRDVAFVIGGADGLSDEIKRNADMLWSLSKLTLPHALVRVVLAEQLYRAVSILKGHPYHRA